MMKKFKENCDKATDFLESCWDENNPDDGLTFDERVQERLVNLDDGVKKIVLNCVGWC